MRYVFRWDASSRQRIPPRVVLYNVAYVSKVRIGTSGRESERYRNRDRNRDESRLIFLAWLGLNWIGIFLHGSINAPVTFINNAPSPAL